VLADSTRRLYRSRDNRVVAGVAGGLGAHLGVDPVLIRISLVALAFAGAFGILAYLIAWLVIPEAPAGEEPAPPREASSANGARVLIGTLLMAIGILLLLDLYLPVRRVVGPAAVIVIGLAVIAYGLRR